MESTHTHQFFGTLRPTTLNDSSKSDQYWIYHHESSDIGPVYIHGFHSQIHDLQVKAFIFLGTGTVNES